MVRRIHTRHRPHTVARRASLVLLLAGLAPLLLPGRAAAQESSDPIQHVRAYYEPGRFVGWPANLGMWMWGDELLVGFVEARYEDTGGFHTYDQATGRDHFARSTDGGLTWTVENAFERGQTAWRYNNQLEEGAAEPVPLTEPIDFTHPDLALTFLRQTNHTGPSHFYYSYDRGQAWRGPFALPNLGTRGIATRTDYIVDGPDQLTAFFTVGKSDDREGRVLAARTRDGGLTWERLGWLGPEPERFEIMPASVRLGPEELLTVVRRREGTGEDLLSSYRSTDDGATWSRGPDPVADTGDGGSPPALVTLQDGDLALAYVVRSEQGSRLEAKRSADGGRTWGDAVVLRADGATKDVGYPRMVQRPDGRLVVVYYWNNVLQEGAEPWRYLAATHFDPSLLP